jgi:hypothetical protein
MSSDGGIVDEDVKRIVQFVAFFVWLIEILLIWCLVVGGITLIAMRVQ